jgi:hypothetical protein
MQIFIFFRLMYMLQPMCRLNRSDEKPIYLASVSFDVKSKRRHWNVKELKDGKEFQL